MQSFGNIYKVIVTEPTAVIKGIARGRLRGKWGTVVTGILIMYALIEIPMLIISALFGQSIDLSQFADLSLISSYSSSYGQGVIEFSPLADVYVLFVTGAFEFGIAFITLMLIRAREVHSSDIFAGFSMYSKTLGLYCYMMLFIFLWAIIPLAGIVLAVIAALRYNQAFYILFDNPEMSIPDIVRASKFMMDGNKGKLFILKISFIGWGLLACIPPGIAAAYLVTSSYSFFDNFIVLLFSIGFIWVMSYERTAEAIFYEMLTGRMPQSTMMGVYNR
ncbi:MAG: DUF975 family protein [Anaerovoracaceae bacterium]|jgi:uncharacterized membrane protein